MKKIEELQAMSQDELVAHAHELEQQVEKEKANGSYWYGKYNAATEKLSAVLALIKSITVISEQS